MRLARTKWVVLWLLVATTGRAAAAPPGPVGDERLYAASLPKGTVLPGQRVRPVDLAGDGRRSLVILSSGRIVTCTRPASENTWAVKTSRPWRLPDSCAATGSVPYAFIRRQSKPPRHELAVLAPDGVWVYASDAAGPLSESPEHLLNTPVALPPADATGAAPAPVAFDFPIDLDGDGIDELLVPADNGLGLWKFDPAGDGYAKRRLPRDPTRRVAAFQQTMDNPDDRTRVASFTGGMNRWRGVDDLVVMDTNRDGLLDLVYPAPVAAGGDLQRFDVFRQARGMVFSIEPDQALRVPADSRTELALRDFDGDGRLDALTVRGNLDLAQPRTVTRLYLAADSQGGAVRDSDRFVTKDPLGIALVGDYDGDGRQDFASSHFASRLSSADDLIDLALSSRLRFRLQFHMGQGGGRFEQKPAYEQELTIEARPEVFQRESPVFLPGDMNGDGATDLLVRVAPERLAYHPSRGGIRFDAQPFQTFDVTPDSVVDFDDLNGDGLVEVIVSDATTGDMTTYSPRRR